jgi:hypothetical protein
MKRLLLSVVVVLLLAAVAQGDLSTSYIELLSGGYYAPGVPETLAFRVHNNAPDGEAIMDIVIQIESYWVFWIEDTTLVWDEIEPGRPSWLGTVDFATGCPDYCIALIFLADDNGVPGEVLPGETVDIRIGCVASQEECPAEISINWWFFGDQDGGSQGIFSVNCGGVSPVQDATWGAIKALYR